MSLKKKKQTFEESYEETLGLLAEARGLLLKVRSRNLIDDTSPFNPGMTGLDAENIISRLGQENVLQ